MSNVFPIEMAGGSKDHCLHLTAEMLHDEWLEPGNNISAKFYLKYLLLALSQEGAVSIRVSEFCERWDINQRTFYRAKAELMLIV